MQNNFVMQKIYQFVPIMSRKSVMPKAFKKCQIPGIWQKLCQSGHPALTLARLNLKPADLTL
jgi:hypothetical protein